MGGAHVTTYFVEAANQFTSLLKMDDQLAMWFDDGQHLPYGAETFDGGYALQVRMNVSDRETIQSP